MQTDKLFYQDPYLQTFSATILKKTPLPNNRYAVVLDRTAFYPEGGGQPCDTGALNEAAVVDVQTEGEEIIHITIADPGDNAVDGRINWRRRFDHMQQHTGEHILSGIFLANFQAQNVGFHLSASTCQIDVTLPSLSPEEMRAVEDAANQVIFANLPVAAKFVGSSDLPDYKLRKEPGEFANIRLVSIKDCDCCPCGGTHVGQTGDVGLLKIRGWEKRKNNIRVDFVCGGRALEDYRLKHEISRSLSVKFSVPVDGILAAVEKNIERQDFLMRELSAARKAYHEELAARLLAETDGDESPFRIITRVFQGYGSADLQDFSSRIIAVAGSVCLLSSVDSAGARAAFFFASAPDIPFSMSDLLKSSLPTSGKGGGNATQAQGGAPTDNPADILSAAKNQLLNKLATKE